MRWRSASDSWSKESSPRRSGRRPWPAGTCRLRLTVMATHRMDDLRHAARLIGSATRELAWPSRPLREAA